MNTSLRWFTCTVLLCACVYPFGNIHGQGPGDQSDNLMLWLKANDGFTVEGRGGPVYWADQSGGIPYVLEQIEKGKTPKQITAKARGMNFNPSVSFQNNTEYLEEKNFQYKLSDYTIFMVSRAITIDPALNSVDKGVMIAGFDAPLVGDTINTTGKERTTIAYRPNDGTLEWNLNTDGTQKMEFPSKLREGIPHLITAKLDGNGEEQLGLDGIYLNKEMGTGFFGASPGIRVGADYDNLLQSEKTHVAEIVIFSKAIDSLTQFKVETYLALKYAIQIPYNHYVNTEGEKLFDYETYENDIAGIGIDDSQDFYQHKSISSSSSAIHMIQEQGALGDNEYLIWGHDGAPYCVVDNAPEGFTRFERVWRANVQGQTGLVRLKIDLDKLPEIPRTSPENYRFLMHSEEDFSNPRVVMSPTRINGDSLVFENIDFKAGDFFTLAFNHMPLSGAGNGNVQAVCYDEEQIELNLLVDPSAEQDGIWGNQLGDTIDSQILPYETYGTGIHNFYYLVREDYACYADTAVMEVSLGPLIDLDGDSIYDDIRGKEDLMLDLGPDQYICEGASASITAKGFTTKFIWQDGSTSPTFSTREPGQYYVQASLQGCEFMDTVNVFIKDSPLVDLGSDTMMVEGYELQLDAFYDLTTAYQWNTGETTSDLVIDKAGNYLVHLDKDGCTVEDQITVAYEPEVVVELGQNQLICEGDAVTLQPSVSFGESFEWQDGSTNSTFDADTSGIYWVEVRTEIQQVRDSISLEVVPYPNFAFGNDTTLLEGQILTIGAELSDATLSWSTGDANSFIDINQAGTYTLTADRKGCAVTDDIQVAYEPLMDFELGFDYLICQGESQEVSLNLDGWNHEAFPTTVSWSNGQTENSIVIDQEGWYVVEVATSRQTWQDSIFLEVVPQPSVDLGEDIILLEGESIELSTDEVDVIYAWNTGSDQSSITVNEAGEYRLEVDRKGCKALDLVNVIIEPLMRFELGLDQLICEGGSQTVTLNLDGWDQDRFPATVSWNTGESERSIEIDQEGWYVVEVTTDLQVWQDSIFLEVVPQPSVDLGEDIILLEGESIELSTDEVDVIYTWNTGSDQSSITVNEAGEYSLEVDRKGCKAEDEIQVTIEPLMSFALINELQICNGGVAQVQLNIEDWDSEAFPPEVVWSNGESDLTIEVSNEGWYTVRVSTERQTWTDSVFLKVIEKPEVDLGQDLVILEGDTVTIGQELDNVQYEWNTGDQSATIDVFEKGTYAVQVNREGCKDEDVINIKVEPLLAIDLGGARSICEGESVEFNLGLEDWDNDQFPLNVSWSSGQDDLSIEVSENGWYVVTISSDQQTFVDSVQVTVTPIPVIDLGDDFVLIEGESHDLGTAIDGASYQWSNGSQTPIISVSSTGSYEVVVDVNGCSYSDEIEVKVEPVLNFDFGNNLQFCRGNSEEMSPNLGYWDQSVNELVFEWSTGSNSESIEVSEQGWYWLEVSSSRQTQRDSFYVEVIEFPLFSLGRDTTLVEGESITLSTGVAASHQWSTGEVTDQITVGASGSYQVSVSQNGCVVDDEIEVIFEKLLSVSLGEDQLVCPGTTVLLDATWTNNEPVYNWSTGSTSESIEVTTPGIYWVQILTAVQSRTDTFELKHIVIPEIYIPSDTIIFEGEVLDLSFDLQGATLSSSDGQSGSTFTTDQEGTYTFEINYKGCKINKTMNLVSMPPLDVNLGKDSTLCVGQELVLHAPEVGVKILWSDGSSESSLKVFEEGWYWVELSYGEDSNRDSIYVTVNEYPEFDLGSDTTLVLGQTLTFDYTNIAGTFNWSDGSNSGIYEISSPGTYSLTISDASCATTDEIIVQYGIDLDLGDERFLCEGNTLTLSSNVPAESFTWQDGSTKNNFEVTSEGWYWLEVEAFGMTSRDSVYVSYQALPSIDLGEDRLLNEGQQLNFDLTIPNGVMTWQDGSEGSSYTISKSGLYWVEVDLNACIARDSVEVLFIPESPLGWEGDTALCQGDDLVLNVNYPAADAFVWFNGSTDESLPVNSNGTYWVDIQQGGFTFRSSVDVEFLSPPKVEFGNDTLVCDQANFQLDATNVGASYTWQDGSSDPVFGVENSGTFSVEVRVGSCIARDEISIDYGITPFVEIPEVPISPCQGDEVKLKALVNTEVDFNWNNRDTSSEITVTESGTYTVEVSNSCGTAKEIVRVPFDPCYCVFEAPKAFTPNADGLNDGFAPIIPCEVEEFRMMIFNRWGEIIFTSYDQREYWSGDYLKDEVQMGSYVWKVEYKEEIAGELVQQQKQGTVMLME